MLCQDIFDEQKEIIKPADLVRMRKNNELFIEYLIIIFEQYIDLNYLHMIEEAMHLNNWTWEEVIDHKLRFPYKKIWRIVSIINNLR